MQSKTFLTTVTITMLLSILIPSITISQYLYLSINKREKDNNYQILSRIRDEKVQQIVNFYTQEFYIFGKTIDNFPKDISHLNTKSLYDQMPNIEQVVLYNYNFKPLININKEGLDTIPDIVKTTIQKNFYFNKYYIKDLQLPNNSSRMVYFHKSQSGDSYISITLDYKYLNRFIKEFGEIEIDIYNKKFQKVASSNSEIDPRRVDHNSLTEKLILGLTEELYFEGRYNSFTHLDIAGETLFINVSIPKAYVDKKSSSLKFSIYILYTLYALGAVLIGRILTKHYYNMKEEDIRKEVFSNRFSFFYRIKKSLTDIDSRFTDVEKLHKALNYFKNDISTILDDLPQEKDEDKKLK